MELRQNERLIHVNGVDLCVETFGDRADAAILLIMGASASMDWWEDELCERLAAARRFVIRYDHRDTGRSVSYEPGAPGYGLTDLTNDAAGVLRTLGVPRVHLVGMSMGGAIAQILAVDQPHRVASLTLIGTSPAEPGEPDLPRMSAQTVADFTAPEPDWADRAAVIDHLVHLARVSAGDPGAFDERAFRPVAARVFDRTTNMAASLT